MEDLRENPFDNDAGGNIGDDDELIPISERQVPFPPFPPALFLTSNHSAFRID